MDDGTPTLEVGFAIDVGEGSFNELNRIQEVMNSTEARVVAEAAKIERATSGMVNVGAATAKLTSFGNAATREMQTAARETAKVEKAGESMVRSLDRQASTFGKTASEIRQMKAETAALAAEQAGLGELAGRIRAAEQALYDAEYAAARRATIAAEELVQAKAEAAAIAEREAAALSAAAAAADRDAREHAALAAAVRGSYEAQMADAMAAESMRERTDPLYAAVKRLNAEIAESTRLYHAGATAPAEYARQQEVLTGRLRAATEQNNLMAAAGRGNANSLKMMAIQLPDVAQGLLSGQKASQIFVQQGFQIVQIAMMAEGGLKAMVLQLGRLALVAAPILAVVGVAAGTAYVAFRRFQDTVKDDGELTRYRDSLGLTRKEMEQLSDGVEKVNGKIKSLGPVTVTFGDEMAGIWKTIEDQAATSPVWDSIKSGAGAAFDWIIEAWMKVSSGIDAGIYGTFNAVKEIWGALPALIGNFFVNAANLAISAMNALVRAGVAQINGYINAVNALLPAWMKMGQIDPNAGQMNLIKPFEGAKGLGKRIAKGYSDSYTQSRKDNDAFWATANGNAKQFTKDRMSDEAKALKANRTGSGPKPKVDHNALNAEAVESQIKNLYRLADAYKVSGAAALIAEARVKAESDAIKKRGDIEMYVDRQIRLAIATRVKDAAQSTAALNDQAAAQERANRLVEAGLMPADRAQAYIQGQMQDLPLLAAIQAAQQRGLTKEATAATAALDEQRQARLRLRAAEQQAMFDADKQASNNTITELTAELGLVGAVNSERTRTLAIVRATADAMKYDKPEDRAEYIADQTKIVDLQLQVAAATADYNDQLNYAADKWAIIASNMREASSGFSDAFGPVGKALGDITTLYADYAAMRKKLDTEHKERLKEISAQDIDKAKKEAQANRENTKYALQSGAAQIDMYGDMISAAKGFFNEKSRIYKALQVAEQVFRAVQLAMSVAAMFQDTAETATHVANAGARASANAAEGVSAQAKLPFPANIAAMAATAAAVVAFGIAMLGGRGGGHSVAPPSSEDLQKAAGTGTVLGSPNDKSASIANSLELVARNSSGSLTTSSEMLDALRSIDKSIGAMAATVAKQINVSGSLYDTTKLNIGSSGSAGFLGLFSSSTTRSLYDAGITLAATTVGNIVANGISGSTYQIVQQVKKSSGFLGIGGGTKTTYQTATGALPSDITASIQRVIGALENGIVTAAGQIGVTGAKAMLDNFTVSIGQLSFNGLDAQGIEDQLNAVFSTVGDQMTAAVFPGIVKFQRVGEGLFETLSRVVSTVEAVTDSLGLLGDSVTALSIDAKLAIADQFDSVGDLTSAAQGYFEAFYTKEEQATAKAAQFGKVFASLGVAMPTSIAAFRSLVDAQDLTTTAGQSTYATLLKLAPAFADLMGSLGGARSAADAADELQQAWKSVGDSIAAEVERIRGLSGTDNASFAVLQGRFNAATEGARAGDIDLAKSLPGLSQALLDAAEKQATSRQELERIRAQTAASLEETNSAITSFSSGGTATIEDILNQVATSQAASSQAAANDVVDALTAMNDNLSDELDQLREDTVAGLAQVAGNTGRAARVLDDVTDGTGSRRFQMIAGLE